MSCLWRLIGTSIPADTSRQTSPFDVLRAEMSRPDPPARVLDLGCGDGKSAAIFRAVNPDVTWIGLDIDQSELAKGVQGEKVLIYDGEHFPLESASIPLIYSQQVFEHVRYPDQVLSEIARVLTPGGVFIGSTSHLEPYHEYSLWNYTPYGFKVLVQAAGLELLEIRPGIDAIALVTRTYEGRLPEHAQWWSGESPLNEKIERWGEDTGTRTALVNNRKLAVCGQFCFRVRKPVTWKPPAREASWQGVREDGWRVAGQARHLVAQQLRSSLRAKAKKVPGARRAVQALRARQAAARR